jgi:hypothetical protein
MRFPVVPEDDVTVDVTVSLFTDSFLPSGSDDLVDLDVSVLSVGFFRSVGKDG